MKKPFIAVALMCGLFLTALAYSQSSNASLSGTVTDASGGIIPGVSVTATNIATGVVSTGLSNNAGVYNFASLPPGKYNVKAEMPGFQTHTKTGLELGNAAQVRLNFTLEVSGVTTAIEVSVEADRLLLESSSSVGEVLPERIVREMPLVNNDSLDLVRLMSGAVIDQNPVFGRENTTFAGISARNVNVQRDGVPVTDVRYPTGIDSPTRLNPDLVGEFRIILATVDAEMGRGIGQVQVQTKSGTNEYHGSLVWDIQNSALDSNFWQNNRDGTTQPWRNRHEYTISAGGPIIKNRTFFFALWNGQISRERSPQSPPVLTPCARNGIFRYYDNWNNGAYGTTTQSTGSTPTIAVVDASGNPVAPTENPDGTPHNGILRYVSVWGPVVNTPTAADCSDAIVSGGPWDTYRTQIDQSGYIEEMIAAMPPANYYWQTGDGLNVADYLWIQKRDGADNMWGVGEDGQRKEINIKIDHIFSDRHRINAMWTYGRNWAANNYAVWPDGFGGRTKRKPQTLSVNFTSTLSPALLNEARFGMTRTGTNGYSPLEDPVTGKELEALLPKYGGGLPVAVSPGTGAAAFSVGVSNLYGGRGMLGTSNRDISPRYTIADTLTWTKGVHSFKFGGEFRINKSYSAQYGAGWGTNSRPYAIGGDADNAPIPEIVPPEGILAGATGSGNMGALQNLLTFFAGSIAQVNQTYFINTPDDLEAWNDPFTELERIRDFQQNEFAIFFKDDWKIRPDLTLNLGLRYEYYGVPYLKSGMTVGLVGGNSAMFGISGRSWDEAFWNPGESSDLTELEFIGPGSANPDRRIYNRDWNNFGPAVGFAWQIPWFGKGKTTVRGGYQISYLGSRGASSLEGPMGNAPGSVNNVNYNVLEYTDLAHLDDVIPVPPSFDPMEPVPLTDRNTAINVFDANGVNPYVQNLTLSVTRNITSNLTVDFRYIGTLTRKNFSTENINVPNFLTNGLLEAFNAARYGDDTNPALGLLDRLLEPVRGTQSGAEYLRGYRFGQTGSGGALRNQLAQGNYNNLAIGLSNWAIGGVRGELLRAANELYPGQFPENFIRTNPQFSNVTLYSNRGHANYHSMQAEVTLRPTHGISLQASWTWSRNLGISGAFTDPRDIAADYTLLSSHRTHTFTSYGTWELPIGSNRLLDFGNSSGVLSKILGGWQMSWFSQIYSGQPVNVGAANMLYANGTPDVVGDFDRHAGEVVWMHNAFSGSYYGYESGDLENPETLPLYHKVADPQCAQVHSSLQPFCTLDALADSEDNIIMQHPQPGMRGNLGRNAVYAPSTWNADMALSKTFRIDEDRSVQFRFDVTNVFNYARPAGSMVANAGTRYRTGTPPVMSIAPGTFFSPAQDFGYLGSKVGNRTFQAKVRFAF